MGDSSFIRYIFNIVKNKLLFRKVVEFLDGSKEWQLDSTGHLLSLIKLLKIRAISISKINAWVDQNIWCDGCNGGFLASSTYRLIQIQQIGKLVTG